MVLRHHFRNLGRASLPDFQKKLGMDRCGAGYRRRHGVIVADPDPWAQWKRPMYQVKARWKASGQMIMARLPTAR